MFATLPCSVRFISAWLADVVDEAITPGWPDHSSPQRAIHSLNPSSQPRPPRASRFTYLGCTTSRTGESQPSLQIARDDVQDAHAARRHQRDREPSVVDRDQVDAVLLAPVQALPPHRPRDARRHAGLPRVNPPVADVDVLLRRSSARSGCSALVPCCRASRWSGRRPEAGGAGKSWKRWTCG